MEGAQKSSEAARAGWRFAAASGIEERDIGALRLSFEQRRIPMLSPCDTMTLLPVLFVRSRIWIVQFLVAPCVMAAGTHDFIGKPDAWFATDEAKAVAANILSYQS